MPPTLIVLAEGLIGVAGNECWRYQLNTMPPQLVCISLTVRLEGTREGKVHTFVAKLRWIAGCAYHCEMRGGEEGASCCFSCHVERLLLMVIDD